MIIGDVLQTVVPISVALVKYAVQVQRSDGVQSLWKNTGGEFKNPVDMTKVKCPFRVKKADTLTIPKSVSTCCRAMMLFGECLHDPARQKEW